MSQITAPTNSNGGYDQQHYQKSSERKDKNGAPQNKLTKPHFEIIPAIVTLVDDILMYGKTHIEHHKSLTKVLERGSQVGIKLNKEKLRIAVPRILYFGHILTFDGIEPDPKKYQ